MNKFGVKIPLWLWLAEMPELLAAISDAEKLGNVLERRAILHERVARIRREAVMAEVPMPNLPGPQKPYLERYDLDMQADKYERVRTGEKPRTTP